MYSLESIWQIDHQVIAVWKARKDVAMSITAFHVSAERGGVKVFPMSLAQEGVWFLDQLEPAGAAYNLPVAIRLRRRLDVEILERSLNVLVQRHEALRTTFGMMEGQLVQAIAPTL